MPCYRNRLSRPTRARGLKHGRINESTILEMSRPTRARGLKRWQDNGCHARRWSRPTRARGLKRLVVRIAAVQYAVAPHAGAWIETNHSAGCTSPASRSRPTRARGLKHGYTKKVKQLSQVAPHAGAWIETRYPLVTFRTAAVAPHAGAWIETTVGVERCCVLKCRAPRGRVD